MSLPRSRHSFAVACLAVLALGSSACVKQNLPGVGLVKFDSSAVFGIPDKGAPLPGFDVPEEVANFDVGACSAGRPTRSCPTSVRARPPN